MAPSGGAESGAGGTHGHGQGVPGEIPGEEGAESGEGRPQDDYIGISTTFPCRWSYADGEFREEPSCEDGVAGFFLFADKRRLQGMGLVREGGEPGGMPGERRTCDSGAGSGTADKSRAISGRTGDSSAGSGRAGGSAAQSRAISGSAGHSRTGVGGCSRA